MFSKRFLVDRRKKMKWLVVCGRISRSAILLITNFCPTKLVSPPNYAPAGCGSCCGYFDLEIEIAHTLKLFVNDSLVVSSLSVKEVKPNDYVDFSFRVRHDIISQLLTMNLKRSTVLQSKNY